MVITSILSLLIAAVLAPWVYRAAPKLAGYVFTAVPATFFVFYASLLPQVAGGEPLLVDRPWIPELGLSIRFVVDGLSLLFAMLITGIGSMVLLYATAYMRGDPLTGRFFGYLIAFMMSMLGLVLCDNLILLFVFWELTSITSFLLIGYYHDKEDSRRSALQALLVTGLGGMALLAGAILVGVAGGSFNISELAASGGLDPSHPLYFGALVCVLLGAFTKSAQYPFHFWLPNAMAAPSPVSAFLHSSTMVKAGVFLLARMSPVLDNHAAWNTTLIVFGGVTMLIAAYASTRQTKLKPILAYSTVSSLGLITMLIGVGTEYALVAAMAYLLAHAFFKASLFLIAGGVTHETHEKDTEKLGGLIRTMPISGWTAAIAGLSLAGAPPMAGFIAKELALKAGLKAEPAWVIWFVVGMTTLAAAFTAMAALAVVWRTFFAQPSPGHEVKSHEVPWEMRVGPVLLGVCTILGAFAPMLFAKDLVGASALSAIGPDLSEAAIEDGHAHAGHLHSEPHLAIWDLVAHPSKEGFIALGFSVLALTGGLALYRVRHAWRGNNAVTDLAQNVRPEAWYFRLLDGLSVFARGVTRVLQNGSLSNYIRVILVTGLSLGGYTLLRGVDLFASLPSATDIGWLEACLMLVVTLCTCMALIQRSRLAVIAILGAVGYSVALFYVLFGAPDLAMTQFAVETLGVVIFVLVVYHLPRFAMYSRWSTRIMDGVIAGVFGVLMGAFVIAADKIQVGGAPIADFLSQNS
ncbi:MAG: proton-conducting transporter membrane subunit, partial [Planctomycetota bacterium]